MSRAYPIWNKVTACIYQSSKNYGVKEKGVVDVYIGTSNSNSHHFCEHKTTHKVLENGDREYRFYLDGKLLKRAVVTKDYERKFLSTEDVQ
jgi:hypothetical protein